MFQTTNQSWENELPAAEQPTAPWLHGELGELAALSINPEGQLSQTKA